MTTPDPGQADLSTKYQKLATEYAKLRAQMTVLKKGLLDEQDKSNNLSDQVHEKDTHLRKQTSEMDALLFRNQQLTKRISLLQEEAETASRNKKSRWRRDRSGSKERHSHGVPGFNQDLSEQVINEELVAKIKENAELKVRLNDIESQHSANTEALKLRISDLEQEVSDLTSGSKMRETEATDIVNHLKRDTDLLNIEILNLEKEIKDRDSKITMLQLQLEKIREKCDELEKKEVSVEKCDFEAQYDFVDEEQQEKLEADLREKDSLAKRLETSLTKIKDVEKDREHWKLEYQLIKLKLEKLKAENVSNSESLGADLDELMAMREEEIKSVWEAKIDELIGSRHMADSAAMAYYLEVEALTARLVSKRREGEKLSREASTARLEEDKVREEIDVIKENYEGQLSAMSDHLAMMTSKLAAQEDQIHNLNFQIKENKKGRK